ncbi:MAG: phospholipase D-like domain-containing protein [Bacteroidales bacterium]|nr:phospholipase D-like domain-containing protein [Bacteroidales bacterium]
MPYSIQTNETNLSKIQSEFSKAKNAILICSPWITSGMLRQVLSKSTLEKISKGKLNLRVVILRLGAIVDMKITDPDVFQILEELENNVELRYHRSLHAKMYVVDRRWAMVGSFNLTGGGFGTEDYPGSNPEAGFEFTDQAAVTQAAGRFNDIWNDPDTHTFSPGLLGFVLSPSTSAEFSVIGVKTLELNMFVQVRSGEDTIIIGQIISSEKRDLNYFDTDLNVPDFRMRRELSESFGRDNLGGMAKALATLPRESFQIKVARVQVLNQVKIRDDKGKILVEELTFNAVPPDVTSEVHKADSTILGQIYNAKKFAPAWLFANREVEAGFDPVELTTKHFSVFGSTGSEYKARLVRDIDDLIDACDLKFSKREEKNLVERILDRAVKGNVKNKQFLDELKKEALKVSNSSQINLDSEIKRIVREAEKGFYAYLSEFEAIAKKIYENKIGDGSLNTDILRDLYPGITPTEAKERFIMDTLKDLYRKLSPRAQKILKDQVINKNVYKKIENYFESDIRLISEETLETIGDAIGSGKMTIEQLDIVNKMDKAKVYRIDLSGIHEEDIRQSVTASVLTQIFNSKKENSKGERDTVFVIEEAHNFAPEGGGKNNPAGRILRKIASEGRKFNQGSC